MSVIEVHAALIINSNGYIIQVIMNGNESCNFFNLLY